MTTRQLPAIAAELRHEAEQAEQHWQSAVGHAIRAGELLSEAKGQVKHGEWLPWLEANFPGLPTFKGVRARTCQPPRIPVSRDGSELVAKRTELDAWIRNGGGVRP